MFKAFLLQILFYTRLPLPFRIEYNKQQFIKGFRFLPLVGAVTGLIVIAVYKLISLTGLPLVSALVTTAAMVYLTGGLHLDGLADSADGLLSNREQDKILSIMKDSRIGAFGVLSLILSLVGKIILLGSLPSLWALPVIFALPVLSRLMVVFLCSLSDKTAANEGMGYSLIKETGSRSFITALIISLILLLPLFQLSLLFLLIPLIIFTILYLNWVHTILGGLSGDTLGALIELSEVLMLFTAVIFTSPGCEFLWRGGFIAKGLFPWS